MAVIKIQYKSDIRRITVEKVPSFEELAGLVKGLFGTTLKQEFVLKYKDEEGDVISVTSDRELVEAFSVMKNQIARFFVEETSAPAPSTKSADPNTIELDVDLGKNLGETIQNLIGGFQSAYSRRYNPNNNNAAQGEVHYGVTCDSCNAYPIVGNRYKCSVCPDYDLCQTCHSQEKHKEHTLNKVEARSPFAFRHCPWARGNQNNGQVVHRAICDSCSQRIVGIRYKCNTCPDYDLCEKCEKSKVHAEHTFTQITRPFCPRRWNSRPDAKSEEKSEDVKIPVKTEEEQKPVEKPAEVPEVTNRLPGLKCCTML